MGPARGLGKIALYVLGVGRAYQALAKCCLASSTYQSKHPGLAMATRLTTYSSGWPSMSFLMGSSCFLPDRVRGISAT